MLSNHLADLFQDLHKISKERADRHKGEYPLEHQLVELQLPRQVGKTKAYEKIIADLGPQIPITLVMYHGLISYIKPKLPANVFVIDERSFASRISSGHQFTDIVLLDEVKLDDAARDYFSRKANINTFWFGMYT